MGQLLLAVTPLPIAAQNKTQNKSQGETGQKLLLTIQDAPRHLSLPSRSIRFVRPRRPDGVNHRSRRDRGQRN